MLGSDICQAATVRDIEPLTYGHAELDITDPTSIERVILNSRPDVVINCAGFTDVDGAESDEQGAFAVNAIGAGNVAVATHKAGIPVVQISSDYVFGGRKTDPYVESDAVGPVNAYGHSKLGGEERVAQANPHHFIVRSSWLFGTHGKNFVETMLSLATQHSELRVVSDQIGCPTWTGHLAQSLLDLIQTDAYGIHHIAASGHCSWYEFALEIFRQTVVTVPVRPVSTEEFPRPAQRAPFSVLCSERSDGPAALPSWQDGLGSYLAVRKESKVEA